MINEIAEKDLKYRVSEYKGKDEKIYAVIELKEGKKGWIRTATISTIGDALVTGYDSGNDMDAVNFIQFWNMHGLPPKICMLDEDRIKFLAGQTYMPMPKGKNFNEELVDELNQMHYLMTKLN